MSRLPHLTPRALACLGLVVLGLAAAAIGCGTKAPAITGVIVTVSFPGVDVDQLALSVSTPTGFALQPKRRPEQAGAALASPQSVSIYLPDVQADQLATCTVTAYLGDRVTATGSGTATLVLNKLVQLPVELVEATGDGAAPDDGGAVDAMDASEGDAPAGDAPDGAAGAGGSDGGDGGLKGNGQTCTRGDECDSTLCVDGVCCGSPCTGLCEACNVPNKAGTCSPEPAGTVTTLCAKQPISTCGFDGTCDGNGACRRYPAGAACKAEACMGTTAYVPAAACDGQGTCMATANVDCAPYNCDPTSSPPACRSTCSVGGTDCQAPAVCAANSCGAKVKKANGAGCVAGADCTSTFCADGVCCGAACTGACMSCNQTGMAGMCLPVAAGKADPRLMCKDGGATTCGKNGLCDGAGACQVYPATTMCVAGSCSGRSFRPARHCDGKGVCVAAVDVDCLPYRCDTATIACFTSCTGSNQCSQAPKRTCSNNVCQ